MERNDSEPSESEEELLACLAYDHADDPSNVTESLVAIRAFAACEVAKERERLLSIAGIVDDTNTTDRALAAIVAALRKGGTS